MYISVLGLDYETRHYDEDDMDTAFLGAQVECIFE